MPTNAVMLIFVAAIVVAVFAFLSIVAWVTAPAKERQARDRFALLKALAEQPGENARRVLDLLEQEDKERALKKARDERRSWLDGGIILIAIGLGLTGMLMAHGGLDDWSAGLIPFVLGLALMLIGYFRGSKEAK